MVLCQLVENYNGNLVSERFRIILGTKMIESKPQLRQCRRLVCVETMHSTMEGSEISKNQRNK